ncbi:polysaccharide pyruvyl transferase family protein [Microvirga sp. 0TCS3.31]
MYHDAPVSLPRRVLHKSIAAYYRALHLILPIPRLTRHAVRKGQHVGRRTFYKGVDRLNDILKKSTLDRVSDPEGPIRLAWARSPELYYTNIGDALSAVMVTALSGRVCRKERFFSFKERIFGVGTIAHNIRGGIAHVWGTGLDAKYNSFDKSLGRFAAPPHTKIRVHATRGPFSRQAFLNAGIPAPEAYGDPVWVLPSIFPPAAEKKWDLGVIVHVTELTEFSPDAQTKDHFKRYQIPQELTGKVKIINTVVEPTLDAMMDRMEEITSCRRILSVSLHGLVFAESYGIPCMYFYLSGSNNCHTISLDNEILDHRVRDLYAAFGRNDLTVYGCDRTLPTDWVAAMKAIDETWQPAEFDPGPMLDAFPLPLAFDPRQGEPFKNFDLLRQIKL